MHTFSANSVHANMLVTKVNTHWGNCILLDTVPYGISTLLVTALNVKSISPVGPIVFHELKQVTFMKWKPVNNI